MNRRFATALAAATVLAAAVPLMTACDAPHAGAAAVVDGDQISVSAVQHSVSGVRAALGDAATSLSGVNLAQYTVRRMVVDAVVANALADADLTVTPAEVRAVHGQYVQLYGSEQALRQNMLQQYGVAPQDIDSVYRSGVGQQKLARRAGIDLNSPNGPDQVTALVSRAARKQGVSVNPRYGSWDVDTLTLNEATMSWLRNAGKQPA